MRQRVGAGLARRGERRRLVDDHGPPLPPPGGVRGRGQLGGLGLTLLAQAVAAQRPRRADGPQGLGVLVLGVRRARWGRRGRRRTMVINTFILHVPLRVGGRSARRRAHLWGRRQRRRSAWRPAPPQLQSSAPADRCTPSTPAEGGESTAIRAGRRFFCCFF